MKLQNLTRREMLSTLTVGGIALRVSTDQGGGAGIQNRRVRLDDWQATDPAALEVAKNIGLDGVMVDIGSLKDDLPLRRPEVQESYREAARQTGVAVSSLALGLLNQIPLKSDPRAEQWVADSVEVCKACTSKWCWCRFLEMAT